MIADTDIHLYRNYAIVKPHFSQMDQIYNELESARQYYPDFKTWFYKKVVPDVNLKQRKIITEYRENRLVGVSIIKLFGEKKLSTLKVFDTYQNRGVGLKLFKKSFEILETSKPFLTVSEEKLPEFEKIFKYYDFQLTSIHQDLYREGKKEYFFNEI